MCFKEIVITFIKFQAELLSRDQAFHLVEKITNQAESYKIIIIFLIFKAVPVLWKT